MSAFIDLLNEPSIHIRLRGKFSIQQEGESFSVKLDSSRCVRVGDFNPGYLPANRMLAVGASLARLRDQVIENSDTTIASRYLSWLKQLAVLGLLEFPLVDESGEQAVMIPQEPQWVPFLINEEPPADAELDTFACVRRSEGAWLIELPMAGVRVRVAELQALQNALVRRALLAAGFLDVSSTCKKDHEQTRAQWEFHDLLFHSHHRSGWHRDPMGPHFPFIGKIDPLPAVRTAWAGEQIPLSAASEDDGGEPFASVLHRRRSIREYDESRPVTLEDLGALLDRAARIDSLNWRDASDAAGRTTSFETSMRRYPTGGASYELEIYPVVDRCEGLAEGMYHYDPLQHHLVRVCSRTNQVDKLLQDARACTDSSANPQVLLIISARFERVMWKYRSNAYSLILRDCGALYQTLYLAATELGLSPCALGGGNSSLFAKITGLDPMSEGSVGEFILGGAPQPT